MKVNHIAALVNDLPQALSTIPFKQIIADAYDPVFKARYIKLNVALNMAPMVLIQPDADNTAFAHLQKENECNGFMLCYEVDDEQELEAVFKKLGLVLLFGPAPAKLFENKKMLMAKNRVDIPVLYLING